MLVSALLPLSSAVTTTLVGCGDGLATTYPDALCVTDPLDVGGGVVVLGTAKLSVPPQGLLGPAPVTLCRAEPAPSGAVGPTFQVTSPQGFNRDLVVEMIVTAPVGARPGQDVALAYYDAQAPLAQRWLKFNDGDSEYLRDQALVRGTILRHDPRIVVGPVLTCGGNQDCPSGQCYSGACQ